MAFLTALLGGAGGAAGGAATAGTAAGIGSMLGQSGLFKQQDPWGWQSYLKPGRQTYRPGQGTQSQFGQKFGENLAGGLLKRWTQKTPTPGGGLGETWGSPYEAPGQEYYEPGANLRDPWSTTSYPYTQDMYSPVFQPQWSNVMAAPFYSPSSPYSPMEGYNSWSSMY